MSNSIMDKVKIQELLGAKEWLVEDILGKGRYGVVLKARHVFANINKLYAIKIVEYKSEDQIKYRERELSVLAKNESKANVMKYYHVWEKEEFVSKLLIKLELCYRSLDVYMKEMSREETQAGVSPCISIVKDANLYRVVFPQILNGLNGIHTMKPKWIHRDIRLANIFVQLPCPKLIWEIQIKVGGFGLARELPTEAGIHLSNQAKLDAIRKDSAERTLYQAPELSGHSYCEKVDMYSAGIVLYLLTSCPENQKQWPSDDEIEALRNGQRDRNNLCHDDEVLADLLFSPTDSLLHKDPEKRPSAEQALRKLPLKRNIRIENCGKDDKSFLELATKVLPEKFTPVNESLGKGAFSKVISVHHRIDEKEYAVKIISRTDVPEKYQKWELDILTKQVESPISHKNIVQYYDSWEKIVNGRPILYIQMELCNKSLRAILQEKPEIVDQEILHKHVFGQLLQALIYIHDQCFVHRDVYPPNILIRTRDVSTEDKIASWVVKLADFGLGRKIDQSSGSDCCQLEEKLSCSAGNNFYRAPEICEGSYGGKVDVYSAGVVLYQLSCYLENDAKIENALSKLQKEKKVDRNNLVFDLETGDRLYPFLNSLVEEKQEKRPTAKEAEQMFKEYLFNKNPNSRKRKEEKQEKRPTAKEAEQNPDPNPNPNPSLPPIDALSLDNVSHTKSGPTQPVENQRDDNVSQDETDSQPQALTHVPVRFEDDDFEHGLC